MDIDKNDMPCWPYPKYDRSDEPHFLFIITPPYSGSTALSALLNTSHRVMFLHPKAEGQWLIPALCVDRWNSDKKVEFSSIKAVWLSKYQSVKNIISYQSRPLYPAHY